MTTITKLHVWPRTAAESWGREEPTKAHQYDLVSINDPDQETVTACGGETLRLEFADIDPVRNRWRLEESGPEDFRRYWCGRPLGEWAMKPADADSLVKFVTAPGRKAWLAFHCHAGLSRSISCAMAVSDSLGIPRRDIFWRQYVRRLAVLAPANGEAPNRYVYDLVMEAFSRAGGGA